MRRVILVLADGLRPDAITPTELTRGGVSSHVVASELLPAERAVLWALSKAAGLGKYRSAGLRARDVARAAQSLALTPSTGLVFVYLNDCDQAGHAHGWMSPQYRAAAAEVDAGVGVLADLTEHSLLIVMADHGGGGVSTHDHAEPHPINDHIPLILAGPDVTRRHQLTRQVSLLDVPPTVLWWFGLDVPATYEGRVLSQAFTGTPQPVAAAV
jgi:phosphopentomutase